MTRLVALYLPQFHPVPENDAWWEPGFTEWTNVAKAKPLFWGHKQPNLPADLGFYDLRVPEVRQVQADMARAHGIEAFCYWHYWFGDGKRLLERPFNEVLASGQPDFPFCLAWANQSWTGIWHGEPHRVLAEQTYPGPEDDARHFYAVLPALRDKRYFRVDGKALFLVYAPREVPDLPRFTDQWRELAHKEGVGELHLMGVFSYSRPVELRGLDSATFNPPLGRALDAPLGRWLKRFPHRRRPRMARYTDFVATMGFERAWPATHYPTVLSNWDNTPRSGMNGYVLRGSTPERFAAHLRDACRIVQDRDPQHRIVFIKSWNEWAEGNHLEPNRDWGMAYLEAVRAVVGGSEV